MFFVHTHKIISVIIEELRELFSQHKKYTWVPNQFGAPDFERTKIVISDLFSYSGKFLPAIILGASSSNDFQISFNQEQEEIINPDTGKVTHRQFAGAWRSSINITVASEDTIAREQLVDLVSIYMMFVKRHDMEKRGVFVEHVSLGSFSEESYANDYIYLGALTANILSEWIHRVPVDTIEAINMDVKTNHLLCFDQIEEKYG